MAASETPSRPPTDVHQHSLRKRVPRTRCRRAQRYHSRHHEAHQQRIRRNGKNSRQTAALNVFPQSPSSPLARSGDAGPLPILAEFRIPAEPRLTTRLLARMFGVGPPLPTTTVPTLPLGSTGSSKTGNRRSRIVNSASPSVKCPRLPAPAEAWSIQPIAVVVRHPAPRIRRSPHIAHAGIERPCAVHKRIPACAREVRLP